MSVYMNSKWYEKPALFALVLITPFVPMRMALHLNYTFAKLMARNPGHGFAKGMVEMIEERNARMGQAEKQNGGAAS
jgi:hypothetical protein